MSVYRLPLIVYILRHLTLGVNVVDKAKAIGVWDGARARGCEAGDGAGRAAGPVPQNRASQAITWLAVQQPNIGKGELRATACMPPGLHPAPSCLGQLYMAIPAWRAFFQPPSRSRPMPMISPRTLWYSSSQASAGSSVSVSYSSANGLPGGGALMCVSS